MSFMWSWLEHPLLKGMDLDDPRTTYLRRRVIQEKPFLRKLYEEWYTTIALTLPPGDEPVLEIGSGAGFSKECIPNLLTSDILYCPWVDLNLDGCSLPFADRSLHAIIMINVFHHIANPKMFLSGAARCIQPGGAMIMIEPWVTLWSKHIYKKLHYEPFDTECQDWGFLSPGPISGANGALPWIVFERDRQTFEKEFPEWVIHSLQLIMPIKYILSGGVTLRSLLPGASYNFWTFAEKCIHRWIRKTAMFAVISLSRSK
jgi:SAM-dependent methyltransferase